MNSSFDLRMGDVDGDGDLDVVVPNDRQPNRIYINDGLGILTDSDQSLGTNDRSRGISLGDVDGDGDLDALFVNRVISVGNRSALYTNDGLGPFTDSGQILDVPGADWSWGVALGDVDKDGDLDAIVANFNSQPNLVYNDGLGLFTDSGKRLGVRTVVSSRWAISTVMATWMRSLPMAASSRRTGSIPIMGLADSVTVDRLWTGWDPRSECG